MTEFRPGYPGPSITFLGRGKGHILPHIKKYQVVFSAFSGSQYGTLFQQHILLFPLLPVHSVQPTEGEENIKYSRYRGVCDLFLVTALVFGNVQGFLSFHLAAEQSCQ